MMGNDRLCYPEVREIGLGKPRKNIICSFGHQNAATNLEQLQKVEPLVQKTLCPSINNWQESKPLPIEGQALLPILSIPKLEE